jgi:hypothetical protein
MCVRCSGLVSADKSRAPDEPGTRLACVPLVLTLDSFILSECQPHRVKREQQVYRNYAWPHQDIGQRIPCQLAQWFEPSGNGLVVSEPVLGGSHYDHHRQAHDRTSWPRAAWRKGIFGQDTSMLILHSLTGV